MIKKLKLSAVTTQPTPTIHCIQFDTDRQIELCFDDIELAGLQSARIYGKKPDGTEFYNDCIIEDGKLIAPLTSQALAVKGIVSCQIQLVFGGTLTTYTFNVVVDDSLVSESAIESSNEYTALGNALAEVEEIIGEIGDGIVKSVNGLKNDISLVDGDNTTVTTDTENGKISVNVAVDNALSDASENPVQNKVVNSALDGKLSLNGNDTMTGPLRMGDNNILNPGYISAVDFITLKGGGYINGITGDSYIIGLRPPIQETEAANKGYVDTQDALNEKLANKITRFTGDETDTQYPSAKLTLYTIQELAAQVSGALNGKLDLTGGIMTGNIQLTDGARLQVQSSANNPAITMATRRIGALGDPVAEYDAANKRYVDNAIAAALIVNTEEVIP